MNVQNNKKVLLIYTGGTIGMGKNELTGALEPLDFRELTERLPELRQLAIEVGVYQFESPIDSSDMSPALWAKIARIIIEDYEEYDGFIILHGTDTMAYTASALSFMLENLTKPVILTGSQLPIGQLRTDGRENLITSIELAAAHHPDGRSMVPEVCIYFNICSEVTARQNRMPTGLTLSPRSTIQVYVMQVSTSHTMITTYCSLTTTHHCCHTST